MPNYKLKRHGPNGKITPQFGFYQSRAKIQAFGGAYANGKTTAAVMKALRLVKDYPGCNGLMARETYPKLNDTLRKEFLKWCPPHWIKRKPTQDDNTCYMHNGSVVNFRYISQRGRTREDGTSTSNLLSATYDWIIVDQVEDPGITYKDFLDLLGRLRGSTTYRPSAEDEDKTMPDTGPRWLILTSNPSHNWYFKEIIYPYILWRDKGQFTEKLLIDPETELPLLELFEGDIYSNKDNLEDDFIRTQEAAYKGQMRERYLLGKWAAFEGLVHPAFERFKHCITREQMMEHLEWCLNQHVRLIAIEGYDFGIAAASCYLFGFIDELGRIFILDGYYETNFNIYEQPERIKDIRAKYADMIQVKEKINADPALFKRIPVDGRRSTGDTIAKILAAEGVDVRPSSNDILPGIAKVNAYLSGHPKIPHAITGEFPGPLIYFCDDLQFIEDEITSYYWKKNLQGMSIDEPMDGKDDAMNTLKYMLSRQPQPSDIVLPADKLPPAFMFWREMSDEEAEAHRRF